ncbi:MAG: hypothetical protein ACNA71_09025 [Kiritimatiellia bacterium]
MKRRILVVVLATLFVVGTIVRIVHFPFRASAVKRVIPAHAVWMSRHVAPAERVLALLGDGALDPVLSAMGMPEEHPGAALAADAGLRWLINTLGQRYVTTAYVESFGTRAGPAFIVSAWVGGLYTHLARLGFLDAAFSGFVVEKVDVNTRIWRGYFPDLPPGFAYISFGIYEGVMFGVASEDPLGAVLLDRVMQRQARSVSADHLEQHDEVLALAIPDRALLRGYRGKSLWLAPMLEAGGTMAVHGFVSGGVLLDGDMLDASGLRDMLPLVESRSSVLVGAAAPTVLGLMRQFPLDPALLELADLVHVHAGGNKEDAAVLAWITNWEHGGRVFRLRVPAVALAMETATDLAADEILALILSRMNRRYNVSWGQEAYGDRGVRALVPSPGLWYGRLSSGERLGFAVWNGLAFLHSSAAALDTLLGSLEQNAALDPYALPAGTGLLVRADLPAAGVVLRMGFSSYVLWQAMEGRARDQGRETFVRQVADLLGAYAILDGELVSVPGGDKGVFRIHRLAGEK